MSSRNRSGFFKVGLLVGAVLGVIAAFIFAPEATDQIRTRLRRHSNPIEDMRGEVVAESAEHLTTDRIILDKGIRLTNVSPPTSVDDR